jgi:hypothetical protein
MASKSAAFPSDQYGTAAPLLRAVPGASLERAHTVTTAFQVHDNLNSVQFVRMWGIGCDFFVKFGDAAVAVPTAVDIFVPNNVYIDSYMLPSETHARVAPKGAGTGTFRIELLG